jgi:lipopolysaccharide/colanic/teichoic acid biosynthesis glycosyltransferase
MSNVLLALKDSAWIIAVFGSALAASLVANIVRHSSQTAKQLALARFALEAGADEIETLETIKGQEIVGEHLLLAARKIQRRESVKRGFDFIVALLLIVSLLPILIIISLAIKSDGGRVLFSHVRIGRNGRKFRCLKFRSMAVNAGERLKNVLETDPMARAEWERTFRLSNDVRVTRIGRFLRRTSLDGLPQLLNVVRGDMSLVGPRPVVGRELERYGVNSFYYLQATPGMFGLWQVNEQDDADYAVRGKLIAAYAKEGSLLQDVRILSQRSREFFFEALRA